MSATVLHGDCRDLMRSLPEAHFDACVTDPPYELGFMGKEWDRRGVAFDPATWAAVLRALKPGAHLLAFGGTRTWHRIACAIEDAGFEVRDTVMWMYGTGFPKSLDVSKGIDKAAGAERQVIGVKRNTYDGVNRNPARHGNPADQSNIGKWGLTQTPHGMPETAPATPEAARWQGWGTALKPAWEPIIVARKPLVGTVAENVLTHGTGALNIDGCRIEGGERPWLVARRNGESDDARNAYGKGLAGSMAVADTTAGRWPANVIHDGSDEVLAAFAAYGERPGQQGRARTDGAAQGNAVLGSLRHVTKNPEPRGDIGTAARFFYSAKASKADRADSKHPTVKPIALMRYLCRLVTPPGGLVLDPFAGSGTTGEAALREGFVPTLIEAEAEYIADIQRRLSALQEPPAPPRAGATQMVLL